MAAKVLLATPSHGGNVRTTYCTTMVKTACDLQARGQYAGFAAVEYSDVSMQRDMLAHIFLASDATHILFVDSDMSAPADLCHRLLGIGKPFTAAAYTGRYIDVGKVADLSAAGRDKGDAIALAHEWNVTGGVEQEPGGLVKAKRGVGFGYVLLARECFEAIGRQPDLISYEYPKPPSPVVKGFFQKLRFDTGRVMSEDLSFCHRHRQAGGEIFIYPDADVKHVGLMEFGVPFSDYLKAKASE
jgi:hypothetical protein